MKEVPHNFTLACNQRQCIDHSSSLLFRLRHCIIWSSKCSPFKTYFSTLLAQFGKSGALCWYICGIFQKRHQYLCHMLVFVLYANQLNMFRFTNGKFYTHTKVLKVLSPNMEPTMDLPNAINIPKNMHIKSFYNIILIIRHHSFPKVWQEIIFFYQWSVLCLAWNNILHG